MFKLNSMEICIFHSKITQFYIYNYLSYVLKILLFISKSFKHIIQWLNHIHLLATMNLYVSYC